MLSAVSFRSHQVGRAEFRANPVGEAMDRSISFRSCRENHLLRPNWLLEGDGFEPVWGLFLSRGLFGFAESSLFGAGKPFVPSPAIRFAERAEGVKGPKR